MMSEFNSPWVGEAGLRVSSAWWGPGAAHLQQEQKVFGARVSWAMSLLGPTGRTEILFVVRIPKGTVVLQNLVPILAAAVAH